MNSLKFYFFFFVVNSLEFLGNFIFDYLRFLFGHQLFGILRNLTVQQLRRSSLRLLLHNLRFLVFLLMIRIKSVFSDLHYFLYSLSSSLRQIFRIFIHLLDNTLVSALLFRISYFSFIFGLIFIKFNRFNFFFVFVFWFIDLFFNLLGFIKGLLLNSFGFLFHLILYLLVVFL